MKITNKESSKFSKTKNEAIWLFGFLTLSATFSRHYTHSKPLAYSNGAFKLIQPISDDDILCEEEARSFFHVWWMDLNLYSYMQTMHIAQTQRIHRYTPCIFCMSEYNVFSPIHLSHVINFGSPEQYSPAHLSLHMLILAFAWSIAWEHVTDLCAQAIESAFVWGCR